MSIFDVSLRDRKNTTLPTFTLRDIQANTLQEAFNVAKARALNYGYADPKLYTVKKHRDAQVPQQVPA